MGYVRHHDVMPELARTQHNGNDVNRISIDVNGPGLPERAATKQ